MFEMYSQQMVIMTAVMFQKQRMFCGVYFSVVGLHLRVCLRRF